MDGSITNGSGVTNGFNNTNGASKAEKFEDEKRRIVESCFSKKDPDGSLVESYITHIRILEDGAYQSSPPPPNANTDQKKPRVIIVAVRKSGRVRMHKARENGNGSFSIGKTWPLDDLTAIESFSSSTPNSPEAELRKQWAGGVGFIAVIGKPYYWQANTPKEKQFFIGSLIKIYMKYTGGKSPELIGFDDQEREQLLGKASAQPRSQAINRPAQESSTWISSQSNTARNAEGRPTPPRQPMEAREPQARPDVNVPPHPKDLIPRQRSALDKKPPFKSTASPDATTDRPSTSNSRMQLSREGSETEALAVGQQQTLQKQRKLTAESLNHDSSSGREDSGGLQPRSRGGLNGTTNSSGKLPDQISSPASQGTLSRNNLGGSQQVTPTDATPAIASSKPPPERRRPPLQVSSDKTLSHKTSTDNMVPAPLATPSSQREFMRLPARSTDRPEAPQPLRVNSPSNMNFASQSDRPENAVTKHHGTSANDDRTEPTQLVRPMEDSAVAPVEVPKEPLEDERPGLGPMIKKKSKADVASAFRRAANAANIASAFKPRAGGAAERLREQQAKLAEGPDGITGVVPAPSQTRTVSNDNLRQKTSDQLVPEEVIPPISEGSLPEVKITATPSDKVNSDQPSLKSIQKQAMPQKTPRDNKDLRAASEKTQKELWSVGVEPTVIDERGTNFATLLDDLGWMGDGIHSKSIDQMHDEIDRELNQAQIGDWLSRFEDEDDRIDAIRRGLDVSIAECEELDGLLTLYGVELGTLNEDIAYIEAQSQGLQVQAANQKLLRAELNSRLQTV